MEFLAMFQRPASLLRSSINLLALAAMLIVVGVVPESLTTLQGILVVGGYLGSFIPAAQISAVEFDIPIFDPNPRESTKANATFVSFTAYPKVPS